LRHADPATEVDRQLLAGRPLPVPDADTDKSDRGSVLVVGGTRETPGGLLLAGAAAMRVGAGRLQLATVERAAVPLAVAVPEARVVGLPERTDGSIDLADPATADRLAQLGAPVDAVLLGTGTTDDPAWAPVVHAIRDAGTAAVVLDAGALAAVRTDAGLGPSLRGRGVAVPNPAELARVLGRQEADVRADAAGALDDAVARVEVVVAVRGPNTWIGEPGGCRFVARHGHPALATAGSGDVLAGMLAGLIARGAGLLDATLWAVHAHATAGRARAERRGLGVMARDLPDELPAALGA
jgi:hydroxyethylthiazole kinase-like uncharacterized protein yjeF